MSRNPRTASPNVSTPITLHKAAKKENPRETVIKGIRRAGTGLHLILVSQVATICHCIGVIVAESFNLGSVAFFVAISTTLWLVPLIVGFVKCAKIPKSTKASGPLFVSMAALALAIVCFLTSFFGLFANLPYHELLAVIGYLLSVVLFAIGNISFTLFLRRTSSYARRSDLVSASTVTLSVQATVPLVILLAVIAAAFFPELFEGGLFRLIANLIQIIIGIGITISVWAIQFQLGNRLRSI